MSTEDTKFSEDLVSGGPAPGGSTVVRPADATLPPPAVEFDTKTAGATPPEPGVPTAPPSDDPTLIGISFDRSVRAQEFLLAMTRLAEDGALAIADAVVVEKNEDGSTEVVESIDPSVGRAAFSGAVWTGLLGLLLGGPVGWLAGLGVGAGAGAVTAKVVDLGVPDDWVEWFEAAVRPGTSTIVLLADDLSVPALEREAARFPGAEVVHATLPSATVDRLRVAFDHS